jgi:hypothetical protein
MLAISQTDRQLKRGATWLCHHAAAFRSLPFIVRLSCGLFVPTSISGNTHKHHLQSDPPRPRSADAPEPGANISGTERCHRPNCIGRKPQLSTS